MKKEGFDFEKFSLEVREGLYQKKPLLGQGGLFTPLIKKFLEAALEGEMEAHLQESTHKPGPRNRRNGKSRKQVQSAVGAFELLSPRDRDGSFEPEIIGKRQVKITSDIDQKIIGLYGMGMSYSDIQRHLKETYDFDISDGTLSAITDRILPEIKEWQNRPLESIYPVIWLDAMFYKVREEGIVKSKAVYSVLGVNMDGEKQVLGIYLGASESASFWRGVLTNLQERGIKDVFIACIDNLRGFADAIDDYFPKTEVQLCLVHQMRNSLKYVPEKDMKAVAKDLKEIYRSGSEESAKQALANAEEKWSSKYPAVFKSWHSNWERLAHIYKYRSGLKRLIYTTNPIESYHRMIRKVTKTKGSFNSEKAIIKLIYLAVQNAQTKWSGQIFGWAAIRQDLSINFNNRLSTADTVD
jgi:transposase-like protein